MDGLRIQPGARAMTKTSPALFVQVRRDKEKPLFRQIADQIRNHVTGGVLPVGSRLPGMHDPRLSAAVWLFSGRLSVLSERSL